MIPCLNIYDLQFYYYLSMMIQEQKNNNNFHNFQEQISDHYADDLKNQTDAHEDEKINGSFANSSRAPKYISRQRKVQKMASNIRYLKYGYFSNPQWYIFLPTYLISIGIVVLLWTQVFKQGWFMYIGRFLLIYVLYRFLSLSFSDPGLAVYQSYEQNPTFNNIQAEAIQQINVDRYCGVCQIYRKRHTRHCDICNVCIRNYDHHCIFIGKCVGAGNMGQFKDFLCVTFGTLIFGIVAAIMLSPAARGVKQKKH